MGVRSVGFCSFLLIQSTFPDGPGVGLAAPLLPIWANLELCRGQGTAAAATSFPVEHFLLADPLFVWGSFSLCRDDAPEQKVKDNAGGGKGDQSWQDLLLCKHLLTAVMEWLYRKENDSAAAL